MSILFKIAVVISQLDSFPPNRPDHPEIRLFSRTLTPKIKGSWPEKTFLRFLYNRKVPKNVSVWDYCWGLMVGVRLEVGVTKLALSCQHRLVNVGGAVVYKCCVLCLKTGKILPEMRNVLSDAQSVSQSVTGVLHLEAYNGLKL